MALLAEQCARVSCREWVRASLAASDAACIAVYIQKKAGSAVRSSVSLLR